MIKAYFAAILLLFLVGCCEAAGRTEIITCSSIDKKPKRCPVSFNVKNASVLIQHSKSPCILGESFFAAHTRIEVAKGCRATFRVTETDDGKIDTSFTIIKECSSINFKKKRCVMFPASATAIPPILSMKVVEKYSKSPCRFDDSFFIDSARSPHTIGVDFGCRALFAVNFAVSCTPKKEIVEFFNLQYDVTKAILSRDAQAAAQVVDFWSKNASPVDQPFGSVTTEVSTTQSTTHSFETGLEISVTSTITAGVEGVFASASSSLSISSTSSYSAAEEHTKEQATTMSIQSPEIIVPAFSNLAARFEAELLIARVPFTASTRVQDGCGNEEIQTVRGTATIKGVVNVGNIRQKIGPAIPVECMQPSDPRAPSDFSEFTSFDWCQPITDQCVTNPLCKRAGLITGSCCPLATRGSDKDFLGCCAVSQAHSACKDKFGSNRNVCPTSKGVFDSCCGADVAV